MGFYVTQCFGWKYDNDMAPIRARAADNECSSKTSKRARAFLTGFNSKKSTRKISKAGTQTYQLSDSTHRRLRCWCHVTPHHTDHSHNICTSRLPATVLLHIGGCGWCFSWGYCAAGVSENVATVHEWGWTLVVEHVHRSCLKVPVCFLIFAD